MPCSHRLVFGTYHLHLFFLLSGYLLAATEQRRARLRLRLLQRAVLSRSTTLRLVPAYHVAMVLVTFLCRRRPSVMEVWPTRPSGTY